MRLVLLAIVVLLVAVPEARAGGWATVGLDSTPQGLAPDVPWNVAITVLQHGRTPLQGIVPQLTIRQGSEQRTFRAQPTQRPGVYRAAVVFPRAGRWTYEVEDGFVSGVVHTFPPADIVPGAPGEQRRTWLLLPGLACLAGALVLVRRRQPQAA
jgi:hypothetical protein